MTTSQRPADEVLTPTVRQSARRSIYWVVAAIAVVLLAFGTLALVGTAGDQPRLSATSAAPDGGMAVAEVLREQGVTVTATDSFDETVDALDDSGDATLLVYDDGDYLDDDRLARLLDLDAELIVLEPGFAMLDEVAAGVRPAGIPDDDPLEAACSLPAAITAVEVSPGGTSYRVDDGVSAELCLASDSSGADDAYSLVQVETGGSTVTVIGATDALTNGVVLEAGNAAFALTLLGERESLVWYLPSVLDTLDDGDTSALTPGWVTPVAVLVVLVFIAAAVWRGRRFGPLVVENLPVVVRASETMEGRARLYQRSSARLRALDALRLGTITRLARTCGLASSATVDEVVSAVAAAVRADRRGIRSLLVDADPRSDAELVQLSDRLRELEVATAAAVRP